ncbi:hypothetical protein [Shewanella cyperi]|uniref:Uncharacterized protein n=1 Tax=Shewanella cyperi TaxID=2814292 RepID=A0A974XIX4_9GAMM|nr:hypothetical protein [Shewanella cyperi]QSX29257.1 hypothetical protein JYB88_13670 [Shewanella cyperi]QSX40002.1 hypothetical protein JYB84_13575 [Shewanella cyperi]
MKSVLKVLKILHWLGLGMLLVAVGLYFFTPSQQGLAGIMLISVLAGLGLVLMSPYPVVLFIEWARSQPRALD